MDRAIKMLTIDLDGTLLTSKKTVSPHTLAVLQSVREKGIIVAIATGRMYQGAKKYGDMLHLGDSPLLLFAGGLIETLQTKKILYQQPISLADTRAVLALARKNGWQMQTYIDDVLGVEKFDFWAADYERFTGCRAVAYGEDFYTPRGPSNKLLSRGEHAALLQRKKIIEQAFPGKFLLVFSNPTFLEIMPKSVNKGLGIQRLGALYGIKPENIMAFGDSENDLDMLEAAGFSVAMENAAAVVKEKADVVTKSNDADGVAAAIEKYVFA